MKTHKEELERKIEQFNTINGFRPAEPIELILVSEQKPTNYFYSVPDIKIFDGKNVHFSWFVEVWANKRCLFRESMTNQEEENLHEYEELLCGRILLNIFTAGINHMKDYSFRGWSYEKTGK